MDTMGTFVLKILLKYMHLTCDRWLRCWCVYSGEGLHFLLRYKLAYIFICHQSISVGQETNTQRKIIAKSSVIIFVVFFLLVLLSGCCENLLSSNRLGIQFEASKFDCIIPRFKSRVAGTKRQQFAMVKNGRETQWHHVEHS